MVTFFNYALRAAHVRLNIRSCVRGSNMETEWSSSISFQQFRNRFSYLLCALLMCTTKMMAYESYLWFCIRSWMLLLHFQYWINRKQFEENRVFYFFMTLSKNITIVVSRSFLPLSKYISKEWNGETIKIISNWYNKTYKKQVDSEIMKNKLINQLNGINEAI